MKAQKKIYGLTNDVVFKYVFGSNRNRKLAMGLLNSLLNLEGDDSIVGITFLDPFSKKNYPSDRGSVVDVKVTDGRGLLYFMEAQVTPQTSFAARAVFYVSKLFSEQIKKAQGFDQLRKATGISFLEFDLFDGDPQVHSIYRFRNSESSRELTDLMELHFVELSKFNIKMPRNQMSRFEKWLYLFRKMPIFVSGGEPIPPEIAAEEDLVMTIAQVKKVNSDTRMRYIIEAQERWDHDVATRLSEARKVAREEGVGIGVEKGIGIGVEKGIEKGRREEHEKQVLEKMNTVENMAAKGFSLEQIADMTGWQLSEIEALKKEYPA